mmetsp:Transcript_25287/g.67771  ORF Transcript_25287/g.67771 Transcript_25287/m.67771 type:complete len:238 (+) Transcript_25287:111-824(+)|eukprot:3432639-Prymnesium_polylepis.1
MISFPAAGAGAMPGAAATLAAADLGAVSSPSSSSASSPASSTVIIAPLLAGRGCASSAGAFCGDDQRGCGGGLGGDVAQAPPTQRRLLSWAPRNWRWSGNVCTGRPRPTPGCASCAPGPGPCGTASRRSPQPVVPLSPGRRCMSRSVPSRAGVRRHWHLFGERGARTPVPRCRSAGVANDAEGCVERGSGLREMPQWPPGDVVVKGSAPVYAPIGNSLARLNERATGAGSVGALLTV